MKKIVKYRLSRSLEPDEKLWDDNYVVEVKFKFMGFYLLKYEKHLPK